MLTVLNVVYVLVAREWVVVKYPQCHVPIFLSFSVTPYYVALFLFSMILLHLSVYVSTTVCLIIQFTCAMLQFLTVRGRTCYKNRVLVV